MKLNKITFGILALSIAAMPAMADEMMDHSKMEIAMVNSHGGTKVVPRKRHLFGKMLNKWVQQLNGTKMERNLQKQIIKREF